MSNKCTPLRRLLQYCHPWQLVACGLGTGHLPYGPGTWGSLLGVALAAGIGLTLGSGSIALIALLLLGLGLPAASWYDRRHASHDNKAIVIDEIVAMLFICSLLPALPAGWVWWLAGFGLFRLLDILKPWPISVLDRRCPGALGVMVDDLAAAGGVIIIVLLSQMFGLR